MASESNDPTYDSSGVNGWEVIPILKSFAVPRRFAKLPCFMMDTPVRNKDFFGRESILRKLDECLLPLENVKFSSEPRTQKLVVVCCTAGIGKTSIAIEFAFARREKFDAIFWIRADEPANLEQGMSSRNLPFLRLYSRRRGTDPGLPTVAGT
jgi:hypothetical protein